MNFNKAMEMKNITVERAAPSPKENVSPEIRKKEVVITSRDVEYFD